MKVLVISRNAWDDSNSIGNTLSNFFKGLENVEFANIYFRSSYPDNDICKLYYHVTEGEILRKWFSPQRLGRKFVWNGMEKAADQYVKAKNEKSLIRFIQKHNFKAAYKLSDYLWYRKKWLNDNFNEFIKSFSPDVIVTFAKSAPQYYLAIRYLREEFQIPLFSWIADDEYTGLLKEKAIKKIENLKYILRESVVVCGCSEQICDYYNSIFKCNATPLYKGCDLSMPVKESIHTPIKIVYAGNLLYGRMEIIKLIVDLLEKYDGGEKKVSFDIYSNTLLSSEEQKYFEEKKVSRYLGKKDYEIIVECLGAADIVLHVESFKPEQILKTKYSFSTKIIDCLQSGSILLAVGPGEVSSIEYVKKIPGACVIDDLNALDVQLSTFLDDTESFTKRAEQIRMFAQMYHDIKENTKKLNVILRNAKGE